MELCCKLPKHWYNNFTKHFFGFHNIYRSSWENDLDSAKLSKKLFQQIWFDAFIFSKSSYSKKRHSKSFHWVTVEVLYCAVNSASKISLGSIHSSTVPTATLRWVLSYCQLWHCKSLLIWGSCLPSPAPVSPALATEPALMILTAWPGNYDPPGSDPDLT